MRKRDQLEVVYWYVRACLAEGKQPQSPDAPCDPSEFAGLIMTLHACGVLDLRLRNRHRQALSALFAAMRQAAPNDHKREAN